jgi:hypothetical protein
MKRYPEEVREFIRNNVVGTTTKDLVKIVNCKFDTEFTVSKMKTFKGNHKLKSGTPLGLPAGRPTKLFPQEVRDFIAKNYKGVGPKEMTETLNTKFNRNYTIGQIKSYYCNNNINSGLKGYFKPGHVPTNKGKKGSGGWEPTQFKKGRTPENYRPVGSERVNVEGYIEIKVADPNKWNYKHVEVWEKHNGPVPDGHVVIFGDRNKRNFNIDNLILISRRQLLTLNRNNLIQKDTDLTRTGVIIADLYQKINERRKGGNQ